MLISNAKIYGKQYGSGLCYYCLKCGAYVGTHKPRPTEAMGILADKEMRDLKVKCHSLFDVLWKSREQRKALYKKLSRKLNISESDCHFGYFDKPMLNRALEILTNNELE